MDKRDFKVVMNKVFLTIIGVLLLVSCNPSGSKKEPSNNNATNERAMPVAKVRKPLSFSGTFYQITNVGSANIVFTEGDYSIEAEAPENIFNVVNVNVDSNVLTVSIENEGTLGLDRFSGSSQITLYVSCPSLQLLAVCGTGNFQSVGTIHNDNMHVGCLGAGSIDLDTVMTTGLFKYESTGDGNAVFRHIHTTQECKLLLSGVGNTTADVDVADRLLVQNDFTGNVSVSGKAKVAELTLLEKSNCIAAFDADCLNLTALRGDVVLKGKYKQKNVHQGKHAKVTYENK